MGGSSGATPDHLNSTRWFPSALGMTRGVQGWTSHLLELIQVSVLTFHLLIHQNHEAVSKPSPWQSLEASQPQPFHATPTATLAYASQGRVPQVPEHRRLRRGTPQHPEAAQGTDTCSTWLGKFKVRRHLLSVLAFPVLIKAGIIITHMLGLGSRTLYLCSLEEEVVSLGKCMSASVRLDETRTLGRSPEKTDGSAAGFAAYKPVDYTARFFRQPLPSHSCLSP